MFSLRNQPISQSTLIIAPRAEWELLWGELSKRGNRIDHWIHGEWQKPPTMADLRGLHRHASQTPAGTFKMAAVPFADTLSRETANSLLKILEEPPAYFWTILFAESETVLPTIYSRVRVVRFSSTSDTTITTRERLATVLSHYDSRLEEDRQRARSLLYYIPLIHATIQLPVIEEAFQPES